MLARGGNLRQKWDAQLIEYQKKHPEDWRKLWHGIEGTLPEGWDSKLTTFQPDTKGMATRKSSAKCLNAVAQMLPWMIGGSADLSHSCLTGLEFEGAGDFMPPSTGWGSYAGRNVHFGIREHAMGSIMNGLALCKVRPFGSTFLVFKTQPDSYIMKLLPDSCRARVSIEAGRRDQWAALVGLDGEHVGMRSFGESGPQKQVLERKGFTPDQVVQVARRVLDGTPLSIASRAAKPPRKRRKVCA